MLLDRGYGERSSLKLVGDRHRLTGRQRLAVLRLACPDRAAAARRKKELPLRELAGRALHVDGYNVLITVETALAGGAVLEGRDGCFRDLASLHSTYRSMEETPAAIERVGRVLAGVGARAVHWLLDAPVSGSGRLAARLRAEARERGWPWEAETVTDPDAVLGRTRDAVASSDRRVLDACARWVNLAGEVVARTVPDAWIVSARVSDA